MAASKANPKGITKQDSREGGMLGEEQYGALLTEIQDHLKRAQEIIF